MPAGSEALRIYESLADWYERQSQAQMRDRFLLLAADTALAEGQPDEAERLRLRLLQHSPHHMLRPFASFAEALRSPDVQGYLGDLRQTYPPETAEQLLGSLRAGGAEREPIPSLAPPPPREAKPPPAPPKREVTPPPAPVPTRPAEPLKVYRVKDDETEPLVANGPSARPAPTRKPPAAQPPPAPPTAKIPPRPAAAPRTPASAIPPPSPAPPPRPPLPRREEPVVYRTQPLPPPPPREEPAPTEPMETVEKTGGWVAVGLFVVVLVAGLALAAYTFAGPFLPPQWLP